ncbi:MAG: methyltransferase, partial [Daejeonella sp.]|nr:methyltransferase [Daejeonella sp.]
MEEKRMFGGLAFMVDGKMCISAGTDRMMCRIDPELHEEVIKKEGCQTVMMKGRKYKGYVYVSVVNIQNDAEFDYWLKLALDFNKRAKPSK